MGATTTIRSRARSSGGCTSQVGWPLYGLNESSDGGDSGTLGDLWHGLVGEHDGVEAVGRDKAWKRRFRPTTGGCSGQHEPADEGLSGAQWPARIATGGASRRETPARRLPNRSPRVNVCAALSPREGGPPRWVTPKSTLVLTPLACQNAFPHLSPPRPSSRATPRGVCAVSDCPGREPKVVRPHGDGQPGRPQFLRPVAGMTTSRNGCPSRCSSVRM